METKSIVLLAPIIGILLLSACGIKPKAWQPQPAPALSSITTSNEKLTKAGKIDLKGWYGPEDIVFDSLGNLYCGVHIGKDDFTDGRILKIDTAGNIEEFYNAGGWVAGLHFDKDNNLIALSHTQGLISISPDKQVTVLAKADENGKPFLIPNGIDIASDGKIYFSNTSEKQAYSIKYGRKVILEMAPLGGLYCYNPATKKITTLIDGTYFGNGVTLSANEDYLLMAETTKYRVLRYWLKGPKAGTTEVFIDNLPGFPNGISIRNDGSYWLGFTTLRTQALDNIHAKPGMKKLVYGLPNFMQPKAVKFGMVMHLSADGKILETLLDTKGSVLPEAGAVKEQNGSLYIGGDVMPYIAKYPLND